MAKGRRTKEETTKLKEFAKILFIKENVTSNKELAQRVEVTEKTIAKWREDGKWDSYKRNIILTRQDQLNLMFEELEQLTNSIKNKDEGDRFANYKEAQIRRQLIKDIKDLESKALVSEHVNSLTEFLNFLRSKNLEKAKDIAHYIDLFIKSKLT